MTPTEQQQQSETESFPRPPSRDEPVADGGSNWNRRLSEEEQQELGDDVQGLPPGKQAQEEAALVGDDEKEIPAQEYNEAIESDLSEREERKSFEEQADRELADDAAALHEDEEITADDTEVEDGPAAPRVRKKPVPNPSAPATKQKQVLRERARAGKVTTKKAPAAKKKTPAPKKKAAAPKKKVVAKKSKAAPKKKAKVAPKKATGKSRSRR